MAADSGLAIFGAVAAAHALGVASPGPDFAVVLRQSLAHGRSAGVWTAAGIASGIVFHVAYGLLGLRWLTQKLPWSLHAIAIAGALFLLWLGVQALRAQPLPAQNDAAAPLARNSGGAHYLIGLATNVLNPKAMLFFVALFTTIVSGPLSTAMMLILAAWLPLATFAWFASLALLLSHAGLRSALHRHAHRIDHAMGAVLLLLGGAVLLRESRALLV